MGFLIIAALLGLLYFWLRHKDRRMLRNGVVFVIFLAYAVAYGRMEHDIHPETIADPLRRPGRICASPARSRMRQGAPDRCWW
ncbi:hypothetical protein ACTXMB_02845 [Arthrobacter rhombi]|uniref:hypothetical protein n=1 Tax=Arthrobacter rhombi TaxID=71253 RepID=UPI003FD45EA6